jgi:hypothetical protein
MRNKDVLQRTKVKCGNMLTDLVFFLISNNINLITGSIQKEQPN